MEHKKSTKPVKLLAVKSQNSDFDV